MKNILFLCSSLIIAFTAQANELLFFYPINYTESSELFIKLAYPIEDAFILYENEKIYFEEKGILLKNIPEKISFELGQTSNMQDYKLVEETLVWQNDLSENILMDKALYKAISSWSIKENQDVPLSSYLKSLVANKQIHEAEILSFAQQFYKNKVAYDAQYSFEDKLDLIFKKDIETGELSPCGCGFILNHFASVAPLNYSASTLLNGYNYLNTSGTLSTMLAVNENFQSTSPKWHTWYTKEKGPAHDMFLRSYDEWGQFKYQWSTLGYDNNNPPYNPSPNYAYNSFQFMCVGYDTELPKDCDCTKTFCSVYEYNNFLKVLAHRLKPTAKVSAAAEELAVLTLTNKSGVHLIDANRDMLLTQCKGSFNFDFLQNFLDLGKEIVQVVIEVNDTTNGSAINDIPAAIDNIGSALIDLVRTPPILVTGDCEDKMLEASLLRNFKCFELKANDPTTITLQSYTFLGVSGERKWDNYAIARSDFRLQSFVLQGSNENYDHCCSDKFGVHLYANMGGPISEHDHNTNTQGAYNLMGPWDNYTPVGYLPTIPINANRGYYSLDLEGKECAPIHPAKKLEAENWFSNIANFTSPSKESILRNFEEEENLKLEDIHFANSIIELQLFPNPSSGNINLSISGLQPGRNLKIKIYNALGSEVASIFEGQNVDTEMKLNWTNTNSKLPNGMYFVSITENNVIISTKSFIFKN
ncbi:MAG: T9SS type A sorting domain-containing protein [Chitinophagales bacterium]